MAAAKDPRDNDTALIPDNPGINYSQMTTEELRDRRTRVLAKAQKQIDSQEEVHRLVDNCDATLGSFVEEESVSLQHRHLELDKAMADLQHEVGLPNRNPARGEVAASALEESCTLLTTKGERMRDVNQTLAAVTRSAVDKIQAFTVIVEEAVEEVKLIDEELEKRM